jgi:hypothetical protein
MGRPGMTPDQQYGGLCVLEYVLDLFTASPKQSFTPEEIVRILDKVRSDPEVFDLDVQIAYAVATEGIDHQEGAEG